MCRGEESIEIKIEEEVLVQIPNIFTPNGDNENDIWEITGIENYPDAVLLIYNRWGKLIYEEEGSIEGWNGGNSSEGAYYYVLELNSGGNTFQDKLTGIINLLR